METRTANGNGKAVGPEPRSVAPTVIQCENPATRAPLGSVPCTTPEEVPEIVARARRAGEAWAGSTFQERRALLEAILQYTLDHADEICDDIVTDSGKTRENAMYGEIWPVAAKLRWTIDHGEAVLRPERVPSGLLKHKRAFIEYVPLGVVGVITPWNYPYQNILGPTIHALMAGNGVVVKVSEWVAWSSARFQRVFDHALDRVGYSRDLVQIIQGYGDTGKALVQGGVDKVVFTGSVENGRRVLEATVANLTPVILELGGKDPLIVCDDAALEQAVHATLAGVFINCGQNCLAAERLLVHQGIYEAFEARLVEAVSALRQGPPVGQGIVDCAAIVSPLQLDRIERLVGEAVAQGARVLVGGRRALTDVGQYFEPTVLGNVRPDMTIMNEELFGPVALLCKVESDDEAVRIANATPFGLGSTVMTQSPERARSIHRRLVSGGTCVNDFGLTYIAQDLPFGGVRGSGFGRLNGRDGLRAMTNPKAVLEDRWPLHQPTKLYPTKPGDYERGRQLIAALYGAGRTRLAAAWELVRSLRPG